MSLLQPKSSVNGLLAEMIAKFEEEPPLGTRSSAHGDNPNDLLTYVANLKVNEGLSGMDIKNFQLHMSNTAFMNSNHDMICNCSYRCKSA